MAAPEQSGLGAAPASAAPCALDPCSRLADCLLPVDAPITGADMAAAGSPTDVAHLAATLGPEPSEGSKGGASGRRKGGAKARQRTVRGGRAGAAEPHRGRGATRQRRGKPRASGSGRSVRKPSGEAAPTAAGAERGPAIEEEAAVPLTFEEFLGTAMEHEDLLAQLDVAQEILGQGLEEVLDGGDDAGATVQGLPE